MAGGPGGGPGAAEQMGRNLLKKASDKYSLEKTVQTQLEIYQDILRRHGAPTESGRAS